MQTNASNIVLYFQTANIRFSIEDFQEIYLAPFSNKPPLECLKSISQREELHGEFTVLKLCSMLQNLLQST